MDKKIAGLAGAVAGLATIASAQAMPAPEGNPSDAMHASSYADLLAPIPNAAELLKADDAARAQEAPAPMQLAQYYYTYPYPYYYYHHHHHHHHHHNFYGYRYYHHHHHHHHSAFIGVPGVGGVVVER